MDSPARNSGRILGVVFLIAGSCIGAAMLGMPVITGRAGFVPSLAMLSVACLFMVLSGLLLLEVNLRFPKGASLISMSRETLGFWGQAFTWLLFLFLFYSLMVAYAVGSGQLLVATLSGLSGFSFSPWIGSLLVITLFSVLLVSGTAAVDTFNRTMMIGLIGAYLGLVWVTQSHVSPGLLERTEWSVAPFVLPAAVISFGYHQLIPSLVDYLDRDKKVLRFCIITGSAVALLTYVLWQTLVLGVVPLDGENGLLAAYAQGEEATTVLQGILGNSIVSYLARYFALFAIITSFVGVALSFVDFLADGWGMSKTLPNKIILSCAVLVPPFLLALKYSNVFLSALGVAGGFGAVILYGILPAAMVFRLNQREPMSKGIMLIALIVAVMATGIFGIEVLQELGCGPEHLGGD